LAAERKALHRGASRWLSLVLVLFALLAAAGCRPYLCEAMLPTEVSLFRFHFRQYLRSLEDFTVRLYAKNPAYEPNLELREMKIKQIFHRGLPYEDRYLSLPSHELLTLAFAGNFHDDRVFVLCLGLVKSVWETYGEVEKKSFFSGLQLPLDRLKKLHRNISHANWRLKSSRYPNGAPFFRANEASEDGYINMGYEVIMTEILTRIADDIHLRGGLPEKYGFSASTLFVSLLL